MTELEFVQSHSDIEVVARLEFLTAKLQATNLLTALTEIAECKGLTLLGCNCDNYMHCDCGDTAYRAFERGANRAFEQNAATAQTALNSA